MIVPGEHDHWDRTASSTWNKNADPIYPEGVHFLSISHWWLIHIHCISLVKISWSVLHWVRFCLFRGVCDWYKTLHNRFDQILLVWIKWNGENRSPNRSARSLFSLVDRVMCLFMIGLGNHFQKQFRPIRNQSVTVYFKKHLIEGGFCSIYFQKKLKTDFQPP